MKPVRIGCRPPVCCPLEESLEEAYQLAKDEKHAHTHTRTRTRAHTHTGVNLAGRTHCITSQLSGNMTHQMGPELSRPAWKTPDWLFDE